MERLRHWNQICTFSSPPSQGHSCEWEKPRTVALGAEWTGHCCPGYRMDRALLPWVQSGPGTVVTGAELTRNCCPDCRADRALLPWLQSQPGTVALTAECTVGKAGQSSVSVVTQPLFRMLPVCTFYFFLIPFECTIVMKSLWLDCHLWLDLSPLPLGIWDGWG